MITRLSAIAILLAVLVVPCQGQTTSTYRGVTILTPDPSGAAGLAWQNNFRALADRLGNHIEAADDPGTSDDSAGTGGETSCMYLSTWRNTTDNGVWLCLAASEGAAVWVEITGGGGGGTGHDAVTLDVDADTLLSITGQALGLDTQAANAVFAGPAIGAAAVPSFRSLVAADIPDLSTTYQSADANLTTYAAITPSANVQSLLGAADYSAMRTLLSLVPGGNVQAYDAGLSIWAGVTPSANGQSLVSAADYAAMRALLTDGVYEPAGVSSADITDSTAAGRTLLTAVDAAAQRTALNVEDGADVTDATNVAAAGAVMEADYDAQTVLVATTDDTPSAVTLAEGTVLGRRSGGNVAALTNAELKTDMSLDNVANVNLAAGNIIGITIDGAGSAISTGAKGYIRVPFSCTIVGAYLLADQSGSCVIDVWKDSWANYPPTVADTITASAKPTLSTSDHGSDETLSGWTTSVSAGDVIGFNVDSASTITRLTLELQVTRN